MVSMARSTLGVHGLQSELLEPAGLARGDDPEELREGRFLVGPDDDDRRQRITGLELLARQLGASAGQGRLGLGLPQGRLGAPGLSGPDQPTLAVDVEDEPVPALPPAGLAGPGRPPGAG